MNWVIQLCGTIFPVIGAVWYLSGRLSKQDADIAHIHECIEGLKPEVKELRIDVTELKARKYNGFIGFKS